MITRCLQIGDNSMVITEYYEDPDFKNYDWMFCTNGVTEVSIHRTKVVVTLGDFNLTFKIEEEGVDNYLDMINYLKDHRKAIDRDKTIDELLDE